MPSENIKNKLINNEIINVHENKSKKKDNNLKNKTIEGKEQTRNENLKKLE